MKHAQQHGLGFLRKLSDFIQEKSPPVGFLEITLAFSDGSGKRPLFMSEEFCIYGAFGNGAAVYGKELACLAAAELVYYLGNVFLTHSALSAHQHRKVCRSNGHGGLQSEIQCCVVAYYVELVFKFLKFLSIHRYSQS